MVYITTTMWDVVELSVGERRLEELKTEYWKMMIAQGARVARCRSDDDSPKKLVRQIAMGLQVSGKSTVSETSVSSLCSLYLTHRYTGVSWKSITDPI